MSNDTTKRKSLVGTRIGQVASDRRDKTIKVVVRYLAKMPKYGKYVRQRSVFQAHDPANDARLGDTVEIAPCRPISKTKSWRLVRVVDRAPEQVTHKSEPATGVDEGEGGQ